MANASRQTRYRVEGMDCASCATKIDTAVRRLAGVEDVSVSVSAGTMTVRHAADAHLGTIEKRVAGLGYTVFPVRDQPACAVESCDSEACGCGHGHDRPAGHAQSTPGHGHAVHDQLHVRDAAADMHRHGPTAGPWWGSRKGKLTILNGAALAVAYGIGKLVPDLAVWMFAAAVLVGLVPIARRAWAAARAGTPFSIEMLMTIAATGAVLIGASEEAASVVFLFLIGELLEGAAAGRARASIQSLTSLVPKTALVERDGSTAEVPAESLAVGAVILVRPGDRLPADGVIVTGESAIDEAPVSGESTPVRKGAGAAVFAGTINGDAVLRVRVTAAAADNSIARIVKLVEEAQESKAPTERLIDRFARIYTPAVVAVAALTIVVPPLLFGASWREWIYKGLAILLIGCPCALVISTPAAVAAGLSAGARRGLLLKGGAVLEKLGQVTAAAFDKTGTLTEGKPRVTDVIGFGRSPAEVLEFAAALEAGSSHPLAKAILDRATAEGAAPRRATDAGAVGGKGVGGVVDGIEVFFGSPQAANERAGLTNEQWARIAGLTDQGKTVSVLVVGELVAGAVALRDEPRSDARSGLRRLGAAGITTIMLTGDNARAAEAVGRLLDIDVQAGLLPEDKRRIVGELKQRGNIVAKVGDGINDAPALAAADVGIAMGGGTDVALETADAAVLHGRVGDVAAMIELSRRTMANIRQNVTLSLGLKAVFLVTTVAGATGLWPAILADTGATVLVTANALRLLSVSFDLR